jgi:hypothetical protein
MNSGCVRAHSSMPPGKYVIQGSHFKCKRRPAPLELVVKAFYTGPVINAELLIVMLEKHGIAAVQHNVDTELPDDDDLNRLVIVSVAESNYERAHQLFYTERQDEL